MKLTITGSGSGKPTAGKNLSSLLLQNKEQLFLIDCGEPAARILAERSLDSNQISAIIITHFHPDHSSGIYMVLQLLHIKKRRKNLRIYLPENKELFLKSLPLFYLFPEKLTFNLSIYDMKELPLHYSYFQPLPNDHLLQYEHVVNKLKVENKMCSYSLFLPQQRTLYTSDISQPECLKDALSQAETVIIDALHPAPDKIMKIITTSKNVILTHGMNPQLKKLLAPLPPKVKTAYDGMEIKL